ncbi:MAG: YkgJ family cysteine cluster protein [Verrucomicrobia bacterium]|nr:YkgJ family cysteine cluster protein [Verrucomicrobiota bacterium]MCH8528561.1 YkgJ family cysteine cluster protein [Kiritimatiellia bacterium]
MKMPPLPAPEARRAVLREHMRELESKGWSCAACSGVCCTFVANSMRISPVEARDLRRWLEAEGRWTPELIESLRECVARFRLDQDTGDGRRSLRKTYTCPFYTNGPRGCSIHPDHKPYGCLAFNARRPGITGGGHCASAQDLLRERENAFPEETDNNRALAADPAPRAIPLALLTWCLDG